MNSKDVNIYIIKVDWKPGNLKENNASFTNLINDYFKGS